MAASNLQTLPPEMIHTILRHLPIPDLLAFSQTSRSNYAASIRALTTLELAVLPKRIHSVLAFLDRRWNDEEDEEVDEEDHDLSPFGRFTHQRRSQRRDGDDRDPELYQVGLTTTRSAITVGISPRPTRMAKTAKRALSTSATTRPSSSRSATPPQSQSASPQEVRTQEIKNQNSQALSIIRTRILKNLRSLTLHLYDLSSSSLEDNDEAKDDGLTSYIATSLPRLQSLTLNFSHTYIHDQTLPARFWKTTPAPENNSSTSDSSMSQNPAGTPQWNSLCGLGPTHSQKLRLRNLRKLELNRASITSAQLCSWVSVNKKTLSQIKLSKVRGVDSDFLKHIFPSSSSTATDDGRMNVIDTLEMESCANLVLQTKDDFSWIQNCKGLEMNKLSFRGCKNVSESLLLKSLGINIDTNDDKTSALSSSTHNVEMNNNPISGIRLLVLPSGKTLRYGQIHSSRPRHNHNNNSFVVGDGTTPISSIPILSPALTTSDGHLEETLSNVNGYFDILPGGATNTTTIVGGTLSSSSSSPANRRSLYEFEKLGMGAIEVDPDCI